MKSTKPLDIYVACESVDPDAALETDDPGVVVVHVICCGKFAERLAMREASRLAKKSHAAFHAFRFDRSSSTAARGWMPVTVGKRLHTRKEGDDYVAFIQKTEVLP